MVFGLTPMSFSVSEMDPEMAPDDTLPKSKREARTGYILTPATAKTIIPKNILERYFGIRDILLSADSDNRSQYNR